MESKQQNMRDAVTGLRHKLDDIETQTRFSNKGIYLLCSVVSGTSTSTATIQNVNQLQRHSKWTLKNETTDEEEEEGKYFKSERCSAKCSL
jgi:hypothetical protein